MYLADHHQAGSHKNESHDAHSDAVDADTYDHGIDVLVGHGYDAREGMLSLADAARRAGVTRSAILRWIRSGYLPAETSTDGWMIHAGQLDAARDADERSRLGIGMDEIAHEPVNLNRVDTISAVALRTFPAPRPFEPLTDAVVSPLAELIRDQADVVQDQAETIGWLQSELRHMREHLSRLEAASTDDDIPDDDAPAAEEHPDGSLDEPETTPEQEMGTDAPDDLFAMFGEPPAQTSDQDLESFRIGLSSLDIFSDEAARVRMEIEKTERRINELWREQGLHSELHASKFTSEPEQPQDQEVQRSWLQRVITPWKRT